ncbi:hypothetical protein SELMODRAFT_131679 [Selaginella moellendorffii]|uniref:Peptidase A1 domain-containing protein n=1 Tax=Selaginella moellendorffii TaxID=88036 RepID=D8T4G4_SELML|nr:hypothetical protein SELMODRAFT_131679 [Selaginella moellendorffii]
MQLLKAHDRGRMVKLKSSAVSLPVEGVADPYIAGLYFTQVQLGTPPRTYNLQVDTGSDLLWVNCHPCIGCPAFSDLKIPIVPYDVKASASSSKVPCSDPSCTLITQISESGCNDQNQCGYSFQYGDGSGTLGYLVEDVLHYMVNATATVIFGCGFKQSGDLSTSERALDGIIGFGASDLSFNSQLAKQGKTPNVFAHCLDGGERGGGILVLGNVIEPDIQYTPLVPYMSHYNVVLQSISVNNANLTIDPKLFSNDVMQGTIFDSGTTLAYLPDEAYQAFTQAVSLVVAPFLLCDTRLSRFIYKLFPNVVLYFEGASMTLTPAEYLIRQASAANAPIWCMGWQSMGSAESELQYTIFGDLVLKNKLVVYDLERGRIGWRPFDCKTSFFLLFRPDLCDALLLHFFSRLVNRGRLHRHGGEIFWWQWNVYSWPSFWQ